MDFAELVHKIKRVKEKTVVYKEKELKIIRQS